MPRYIDADDLIHHDIKDIHGDVLDVIYASDIDNAPTADVAPVRHGYWVNEKRDVLIHWHCSACKECFYLDKPNAEYCPHCGAKMDLKEV